MYAGMTPFSNGSLAPAGAVPVGAGLPWDEAEAARTEGLCGDTTVTGDVCRARPAGQSTHCIGHTRSLAKAINAALGV